MKMISGAGGVWLPYANTYPIILKKLQNISCMQRMQKWFKTFEELMLHTASERGNKRELSLLSKFIHISHDVQIEVCI